jgi:hypothetical protein
LWLGFENQSIKANPNLKDDCKPALMDEQKRNLLFMKKLSVKSSG